MIVSFGIVFLVGFLCAGLVEKLHLPRIVGMLAAGILCGPYVLNLLDGSVLSISAELRKIALIIILIKAGLSLNLQDLKKVGRPAVLMSFVPACAEIVGTVILAPMLFGINRVEAAILGSVLAAVSPAVVVPRMVNLIETKKGTAKSIPQMIMAGASCDDIFVIVLFSVFLSMGQTGVMNAGKLLDIPVSILMGFLAGAAAGLVLDRLFSFTTINDNQKTVVIFGWAFLLIGLEEALKGIVAVSGLLAVTSMACMIRMKSSDERRTELAGKFGSLWVGAEVILFVLVGAAVDIRYMAMAGFRAVILISGALVFRTAGVWLCLLKTELSVRERLFCVMAYLPKATVQAAIGSVPLAAGLTCGSLVLSAAVLAIVITAPIGAFLIDHYAPLILEKEM
ncbi:MAG: cation:proton antiporter [Bulleidia sp.]